MSLTSTVHWIRTADQQPPAKDADILAWDSDDNTVYRLEVYVKSDRITIGFCHDAGGVCAAPEYWAALPDPPKL